MRLPAAGGERSLFLHRVREFLARPPVTSLPTASALAIARLLTREHVGSVVVTDADGAPLGIVTDRDLRRKVVAEGRDATTMPAGEVMSTPVVTIGPDAFAFEAILEMTRREIRHLVVTDRGRLVGVISAHDFFVMQASHPVVLAREIARAVSVDALRALAGRVTELVRRLVADGGTAYDLGQLVAELNDRITARVLALATATLAAGGAAAPPVAYAWLLFGSEARREQTLRTDQDNGLVYADPPEELRERTAGYYARFADVAIRDLVSVGFPACPAGIMASNPRWCQPLAMWRECFRRWIVDAAPEQVLGACIHFDLRSLAGAPELERALREEMHAALARHRRFLDVLARDVVDRRVPLTMLGRVAVHRSGPHRGAVDVKGGGGLQLVGAARVDALHLAVAATNTVDRFRAAAAHGVYPEDEAREYTDAFQHLMRLRLVHQLDRIAAGEPPDNHVVVARLRHADGVLLLDALRTVSRLQAKLRERFATDFVA